MATIVALCAPSVAVADDAAAPSGVARAAAGEPAPADLQEANLRFQEGKALVEQGAIAEGCEKLAQSLALSRRGGTLLNLAACRQKQGRYATALKLFQEALDVAKAEGRSERLEIALRGLAETRAQLSWLVITVAPGADAPGLRVALDGAPLHVDARGSLIAVDPGPHAISAEAPGRRRFERTVTSGPAGDRRAVEVPVLAAEAPIAPRKGAPSAAPPKLDSSGRGRTQLIAGIGLLGAGAAITVAGGIFGAVAIGDGAESRALCPNDVCPTEEGIEKNRSARDAARLANVLFPAGLTAVGAGALLLLLRPAPPRRGSTPRVSPAPWAGPSSAGLMLDGSF